MDASASKLGVSSGAKKTTGKGLQRSTANHSENGETFVTCVPLGMRLA